MKKVCENCKCMLEKKIMIDAWPDADLYAAFCINEDSDSFLGRVPLSGTCEHWEGQEND